MCGEKSKSTVLFILSKDKVKSYQLHPQERMAYLTIKDNVIVVVPNTPSYLIVKTEEKNPFSPKAGWLKNNPKWSRYHPNGPHGPKALL